MGKQPNPGAQGDEDPKPRKIILHEKAFAHLTRGMYRSPASAIRELVSNAWDAHASKIEIRTGFPHFVELTATDDGDGFDEAEFLRIVEGGLGNSEKRIREADRPPGRPLIGRLGIGLFGIAQICGSFVVSSKPKKGKPFKARIRLYNLLKEELDKTDTPLVRRKETSDADDVIEVDIGDFVMLDFDPDEFEGTGTRVVADLLHPVFSSTFREAIKLEDGVPYRKWRDVVDQVGKHRSLQEVGEYFRFIWEIAASVPVPYLDATAVPQGAAKSFHNKLIAENFKVFVDGIELFKPVWLKDNPHGYTVIKIPPTTDTPFNRKVSFAGYIAVQEGKQLKPDELRGIMVRVKGVGIGLYDPSLMDYRFNEGPRTRWITGEIYVSEGLEDALNIDRDSFNRFHPQYKVIQKTVHTILQNQLFLTVYDKLRKRSTKKAQAKAASRTDHLSSTLQDTFDAKVKTSSSGDGPVIRSVQIKDAKHTVDLEIEDADQLDTKKSNKQLASSVLTIFDAALLQRTKQEMRRVFSDALLKLLRKW